VAIANKIPPSKPKIEKSRKIPTIFIIMKKVLFIVVVFVLFGFVGKAQTTVYTWKKYGIQFAIPKTHEIQQNQSDAFESGDDLTWLQMFPYLDAEEPTAKGMIEKVAKTRNFSIEEEGEYTSGGYDGYWIKSKSADYPEWEYWLIGFIDPSSPTNFYTIVWWKIDNDKAYDIAYEMSYSFKKMNQ
jgi:hypothetical protein